MIAETLTESANHQITIVGEKGIYECPPVDDDLETVLPETEPENQQIAESCDRGFALGNDVICEKFPGQVMYISDFSNDGTMALCLNLSGTEIYEWIALNELALSV